MAKQIKDKKLNKPRETYYSGKWLDWFFWYVVIGTLTLGTFQHFYLKPEAAKLIQAQKIERRGEREKAGKLKTYDPKDVYFKNNNKDMFYEPNSLEDKTKHNGKRENDK